MGSTPAFLKPNEQTFAFYRTPQATSSLLIELIDACNLQCPTCIRGMRYMKNRRQQMGLDLFANILDKAARLGMRFISLYNWTWGHGGMFQRKRHVFAACKVRCILSDLETRPASVDGFPVRHPDEALGEPLPIVIFGGRAAQEQIRRTIRTRWPDHTELYFCSTL